MNIIHFDEVESTNLLALELLEKNHLQAPGIIIANSQTKGRGRGERQWISPRGNLYMSLVLQPENMSRISYYSFLTACVVGDVLRSFGIETKYKWPNDIMLSGKKLAGILLQSQKTNLGHVANQLSEKSEPLIYKGSSSLKMVRNGDLRQSHLVIGVGLNLVSAPDYAISLVNHKISREDFLQKFSTFFLRLEEEYRQFGFFVIRNKWKNSAYKLGEKITLSNGVSGIFSDIDESGNLLIADQFGNVSKIITEEINLDSTL